MDRLCEVAGCSGSVLAKGLCSLHYGRLRRTGTTEERVSTRTLPCSECGNKTSEYGEPDRRLCRNCYRRHPWPVYEPRVCEVCGETFTPKRVYTDGRGIICSRRCLERRRRLDGRGNAAAMKSYYWTRYGLTEEQVEQMRAGGCAICGVAGEVGRWGTLHIDHDHATGKVRGVLCSDCNLGIGKFNDNPDLLQRALRYLQQS